MNKLDKMMFAAWVLLVVFISGICYLGHIEAMSREESFRLCLKLHERSVSECRLATK